MRQADPFRDPQDVVMKLAYSRNDITQRGDRPIRCLFDAQAGMSGFLAYAACLGVGNVEAFRSMKADLVELRRLLNDEPVEPGTLTDIKAVGDAITRYRAEGRNVVVMPHSRGNAITHSALDKMNSGNGPDANGNRTCIAIAPMASPTTNYGAIPSKYIKPTQLAGDIVLMLPVVDPGSDNFPAQENQLNDALTLRRAAQPQPVRDPLSYWDGIVIHGMDSYLSSQGGRALVTQAATDAYTACAVAPFEVIGDAANPMLVGTSAHYAVIAKNGAGDLITNRPPVWVAGGGVSVDNTGSVTATGHDGYGDPMLVGSVSATIGVMSNFADIPLYTTPPRIKVVTCTKGEVWYETFAQYTRWRVHGEAESTVGPYAQIDYIIFELELKEFGRQNSWSPISGIGRNDAEKVWRLTTPYFEGPVSEGERQPTGRCRITAYDTFGKFAQSSPETAP
jgi:hypothetical protein